MAKENRILFAILLLLLVFPSFGIAGKTIQTSQQIVVIDPGHGGVASGLVSSGGTKENAIVLALAKRISQNLETRYNVLLTRTRDVDIPFRKRVALANNNRAAFFLSIHLHQSDPKSFFLYYFDPPESDETIPPASGNTWKSSALVHQSESRQAVSSFLKIFSRNKKSLKLFSSGAPILSLEGAIMPALLIEPFSISTLPQDPDELAIMLETYARLIAKSIDNYLQKK